MLVGALLLPVAALVLGQGRTTGPGVPLRRDLRDALRGGDDPAQAPAADRLLHRPGGRRRGRQVHPGRGARRVDPGQGPRGRRHARAGRDAGRQAAAVDPAGRVVAPGSRTAPRRCCTPPTAPSTSTRSSGPRWSAARSSSPTATSTPPSPTRAPGRDLSPDRDRPHLPLGDGRARTASDGAARRLAGDRPRALHRGAGPAGVGAGRVPPAGAVRFPDAGRRRPRPLPGRRRRPGAGGRHHRRTAPARPDAAAVRGRGRRPRRRPRKAAEEEARRKAEEEAARKAEEERLERERQEQLAKLRAEEEERKRRELEEAQRREAERQAEEARQRAEEARRRRRGGARRGAQAEEQARRGRGAGAAAQAGRGGGPAAGRGRGAAPGEAAQGGGGAAAGRGGAAARRRPRPVRGGDACRSLAAAAATAEATAADVRWSDAGTPGDAGRTGAGGAAADETAVPRGSRTATDETAAASAGPAPRTRRRPYARDRRTVEPEDGTRLRVRRPDWAEETPARPACRRALPDETAVGHRRADDRRGTAAGRRRSAPLAARSDWAEETPLDDLPAWRTSCWARTRTTHDGARGGADARGGLDAERPSPARPSLSVPCTTMDRRR